MSSLGTRLEPSYPRISPHPVLRYNRKRPSAFLPRDRLRYPTRYPQSENALCLWYRRVRHCDRAPSFEGRADSEGAVRQVQRFARRDIQLVPAFVRACFLSPGCIAHKPSRFDYFGRTSTPAHTECVPLFCVIVVLANHEIGFANLST